MKRFRRDLILIILLSWLVMMCGCTALDKAVDVVEKGGVAIQETLKDIGLSVGWLGPLLGGVLGFGGLYKKWRADAKLKTVFEGVDKAKEAFADKKYGETLVNSLRAVAVARNLYPELKADLQKFRKKLKG